MIHSKKLPLNRRFTLIAILRSFGVPSLNELIDDYETQSKEYDHWITELEGPTQRTLIDEHRKLHIALNRIAESTIDDESSGIANKVLLEVPQR